MKKWLLAALFLVVAAQDVYAGDDLSRAAINGDLQKVKDCVDKGEKVNDIDSWGWTALLWSVYHGNIPVVLWLLEAGADPNIETEDDYGKFRFGTTALIIASANGHHEAVEALLKKNADYNVMDIKRKKAIDYAEAYDFQKCVALLKREESRKLWSTSE